MTLNNFLFLNQGPISTKLETKWNVPLGKGDSNLTKPSFLTLQNEMFSHLINVMNLLWFAQMLLFLGDQWNPCRLGI